MTKRDPQTDVEMDMTPMIDIVFQLIIFFMLITDMTTEDLELLHLPPAATASPDEPDPKDVRPVLNILSDGQILVKREVLYNPAPGLDDQYVGLKTFLSGMAKKMKREPLDPAQPNGPKVPGDALLIRADQSTPFKHIQKVMEICGLEGIQIWKIQLAAAEMAKDDPRLANKP